MTKDELEQLFSLTVKLDRELPSIFKQYVDAYYHTMNGVGIPTNESKIVDYDVARTHIDVNWNEYDESICGYDNGTVSIPLAFIYDRTIFDNWCADTRLKKIDDNFSKAKREREKIMKDKYILFKEYEKLFE